MRSSPLAVILIIIAPYVKAQFSLVTSSPNKNAVSVPLSQTVTLGFNTPADPALSSSSFIIQSNIRGQLGHQISVSGNLVTLTPAEPFINSEEITITFSSVKSATGASLDNPTTLWFVVESKPSRVSPPNFVSSDLSGNMYPSAVATMAAADMDHDNDIDIAFFGSTVGWFENNGTASFTRHDITAFNDFPNEIKPFDIDQDGDMDLILSMGYAGIVILTNDGAQNFTTSNTISGNSIADISIADFDSNGTFDILYSTWDGASAVHATYIAYNQGGTTFIKKKTTSIFNYQNRVADLDNDGDWDIIQSDGTNITSLANADTTFTSKTIFAGDGTSVAVLAAYDFDNDQDIDLLISASGTYQSSIQLWSNTGDFQFTSKTISSEYGLNYSVTGDFDGDGDLDVLVQSGYQFLLLENDGAANFVSRKILAINDASDAPASVAAADFNGDGDLDFVSTYGYYLKYYDNSIFPMTTITPPDFKVTTNGDGDWGDYDNDGDLDLLRIGDYQGQPITLLYENQNNIFIEKPTGIPGYSLGSCDWGDFDRDGDLDILLMGRTDNADTPSTAVYINKNGSFELLQSSLSQLPPVYHGEARWADFNNDGFLDIALIGLSTSGLFQSFGDGNFVKKYDLNSGSEFGNLAYGDYDHDGDLDLAISGWLGQSARLTVLRNDGNWNFVSALGSFSSVVGGDLNWADMDNDGDLDLVATGSVDQAASIKVYQNRDTLFSALTNTEFIYQADMEGSSATGDYNNDGIPDLIASSAYEGSAYGPTITLFKNDGTGDLSDTNIPLPDILTRTLRWGDYNSDHTLDIATEGGLLLNNSDAKNTPPTPPSLVQVDSVFNNSIYFHWNNGTDLETQSPGLSYQVYAGKQSHQQNVLNSNSDLSTGVRKIVELGNFKGNNSRVENLQAGNYFLGVQSIDASFEGSIFSGEATAFVASINGNANVCEGSTLTYFVNPLKNYSWQVIGGSIVSGQGTDTLTIKWGAHGIGYVKISDTQNKNSLRVTIDQKPKPSIGGDTTVCTGLQNYTLLDELSFATKWFILGTGSFVNQADHNASINWPSQGVNKIIAQAFSEHGGCYNYDTLNVNIDLPPIPQIISETSPNVNPLDVCQGGQNVYSTAAIKPTWQITNGAILYDSVQKIKIIWGTSSTSGDLVLQENSTHGFCVAKDSLHITIHTYPSKPTMQIFQSAHSDTLISTPSPSGIYDWYLDGVLINEGPFNALVTKISGSFAVEVFNYNCGTKSDPLTIKGLITITEVSITENSVKVYPIPSEKSIFIDLQDEFVGDVDLLIYSAAGSIVKQGSFQKTDLLYHQELDISDLATGLYVLTLNTTKNYSIRFIKQ